MLYLAKSREKETRPTALAVGLTRLYAVLLVGMLDNHRCTRAAIPVKNHLIKG